MNIETLYPSTYLKAAELNGQIVTVSIERIEVEATNDGQHKPVIYFRGKQKGLMLNKTNARTISESYGPETDDWIGKTISLMSLKVEYQGRMVDGIRVHIPKATTSQKSVANIARPPKQPVRQVAHIEQDDEQLVDDEIPF